MLIRTLPPRSSSSNLGGKTFPIHTHAHPPGFTRQQTVRGREQMCKESSTSPHPSRLIFDKRNFPAQKSEMMSRSRNDFRIAQNHNELRLRRGGGSLYLLHKSKESLQLELLLQVKCVSVLPYLSFFLLAFCLVMKNCYEKREQLISFLMCRMNFKC